MHGVNPKAPAAVQEILRRNGYDDFSAYAVAHEFVNAGEGISAVLAVMHAVVAGKTVLTLGGSRSSRSTEGGAPLLEECFNAALAIRGPCVKCLTCGQYLIGAETTMGVLDREALVRTFELLKQFTPDSHALVCVRCGCDDLSEFAVESVD